MMTGDGTGTTASEVKSVQEMEELRDAELGERKFKFGDAVKVRFGDRVLLGKVVGYEDGRDCDPDRLRQNGVRCHVMPRAWAYHVDHGLEVVVRRGVYAEDLLTLDVVGDPSL